ncbi:unnamed protein product [Prorocentrum cordatum]|uniref:Uncharacterized protein n=1 Tax=Prorocentrum cordatum TaxID=2364126 RepID=A0ABN9WX32_9DINO|nr:unnamed protein product [Polarella glacialis]
MAASLDSHLLVAAGALQQCQDVLDLTTAAIATVGHASVDQGLELMKTALTNAAALALSEATGILNIIRSSPFNAAQRAELSEMESSRVQAHQLQSSARDRAAVFRREPAPAGRQRGQTCHTFQTYVTEKMWQLFKEPRTTWDQALQAIAQRCDQLGLVHPTEPTMVHMWSVFALCRVQSDDEIDVVLGPAECLRKKNDIADELTLLKRRHRLRHWGVLQHYPSTCEELRATSPTVYQKAYPEGALPATCPLNQITIEVLGSRLPCRVSRGSVRRSVVAPARRASIGSRVDRALGDMRPGDPYVPGLQIYGRHQGHSDEQFRDFGNQPAGHGYGPLRYGAHHPPMGHDNHRRLPLEGGPTGGGVGLGTAPKGAPVARSVDDMSRAMKDATLRKNVGAVGGVGEAGDGGVGGAGGEQGADDDEGALDPNGAEGANAATASSLPSLKYPGAPKTKWLYTSLDTFRWRVFKVGDRVDAPFSFRVEPKKAWANLVRYVQQAYAFVYSSVYSVQDQLVIVLSLMSSVVGYSSASGIDVGELRFGQRLVVPQDQRDFKARFQKALRIVQLTRILEVSSRLCVAMSFSVVFRPLGVIAWGIWSALFTTVIFRYCGESWGSAVWNALQPASWMGAAEPYLMNQGLERLYGRNPGDTRKIIWTFNFAHGIESFAMVLVLYLFKPAAVIDALLQGHQSYAFIFGLLGGRVASRLASVLAGGMERESKEKADKEREAKSKREAAARLAATKKKVEESSEDEEEEEEEEEEDEAQEEEEEEEEEGDDDSEESEEPSEKVAKKAKQAAVKKKASTKERDKKRKGKEKANRKGKTREKEKKKRRRKKESSSASDESAGTSDS